MAMLMHLPNRRERGETQRWPAQYVELASVIGGGQVQGLPAILEMVLGSSLLVLSCLDLSRPSQYHA
jgi:hypothetical protein